MAELQISVVSDPASKRQIQVAINYFNNDDDDDDGDGHLMINDDGSISKI